MATGETKRATGGRKRGKTGRKRVGGVKLEMPKDRRELREWVREHAGLMLPEGRVCEGHNTPLDYLEYAFFELGSTADTVVWACRGGGKTTIGAVATLLDVLFKPGIQVKILGGSKEQASRMYACLCGLLERGFGALVRGRVTSKGFTLTNGSKVEILTQSQRAVRGARVQKMRCDEVELFDPEVWSAAQLTTRSMVAELGKERHARPRGADGRFVRVGAVEGEGATGETLKGELRAGGEPAEAGTTNTLKRELRVRGAVEVFSTLHRANGIMTQLVGPVEGAEAAQVKPGARRVFRWCIWDVVARCREEDRACEGCELRPWCKGSAREAAGFVAVEDVLALKARSSRRLWDNEMLCLPPAPEHPVFGAFSSAVHVRAFPGAGEGGAEVAVDGRVLGMEGVIAGIDYGWKKFVCLWIVLLRDEKGRRAAWVVDEYVQGQRDLAGHAAAILARRGAAGVAQAYYGDVAGRQHDPHSGRTSEAVLKEAGMTVKSRAMKIREGVELIRGLIEPPETWGLAPLPRFWVDPRCKEMIAALTQYAQEDDEPVKDGVHDHLVDALRYALAGQGKGSGKVEVGRY